ncbi:unnamed protein product [Rhizophagus irregularis]|nr:unnamed protein product [Rhizophagus irregularis]
MQVSTKTITRNWHELNIFSRIPACKPLLNNKQRENRLNWCIERKNWSIRKWKSVIWSDESRLQYSKMMVQVVFGELLEQDLILKIWFLQ